MLTLQNFRKKVQQNISPRRRHRFILQMANLQTSAKPKQLRRSRSLEIGHLWLLKQRRRRFRPREYKGSRKQAVVSATSQRVVRQR